MLKINNVNKYFNKGRRNELHVIDNTTLNLGNNGLVALLGPSGCGKTTLLNVIGGLDKIKSGSIYVNNENISSFSTRKVDKIRNLNIGYIFQDYKLLDDLTVYENIAISLRTVGIKNKEEIDKRIDYILDKIKMTRYKRRPCSMLSGGERQRVGIARALVKNPNIILADEPTGNLDSKNSLEIMNIIKAISKERLVILVTHEEDLAHFFADRIIEINDGKVIKDYENKNVDNLDYRMENTFYLKDFKYNDSVKDESSHIDIYSDKKEKVDILLIFRNGNIYLRNNHKEKIVIVDDESNVEIINDNYKEYTKKEADNYEFKLNEVIDHNIKMRYSSIFRLLGFVGTGFKRVLNFSILKKILLIGFFVSAMFIMYSYNSIFASLNIRDEDFVKVNRNYSSVTIHNPSVDNYLKISNIESTDYVLPGSSIVNFIVDYRDYYQTLNFSDTLQGSIASLTMISEKDLTAGKMSENSYEIVVDVLTIKKMFTSNNAQMVGITTYDQMIGREVTLKNMPSFKIVGLVSLDTPSIYMDSDIFVDVIANADGGNNNYAYSGMVIINDMENSFINYELYQDKITIKKGRLPKNDYEVIVSEQYEDTYKLNKEANITINDKKLKVVGYYTSKENYNHYLVNETMILYLNILRENDFTVYSKNKSANINDIRNENFNVDDSYSKDKNAYIRSVRDSVKSTIISSSIILLISLIEIFLMIRSSFLSRIKEVGILRAIGIKKMDIYKMFLGEIIAITTFVSIPGILFMAYILDKLSKLSIFSSVLLINGYNVALAMITVFVFNSIVGLLPVYRTIRKRPSEILARNDLD